MVKARLQEARTQGYYLTSVTNKNIYYRYHCQWEYLNHLELNCAVLQCASSQSSHTEAATSPHSTHLPFGRYPTMVVPTTKRLIPVNASAIL